MTQIDQQLLLALKNNLQTASQLISGMLVSDTAGSAPFDVLMRTSAIPHVRLSEALSVLEIFQEFQLIRKVENSFFNIYSAQKFGALQQTIMGA